MRKIIEAPLRAAKVGADSRDIRRNQVSLGEPRKPSLPPGAKRTLEIRLPKHRCGQRECSPAATSRHDDDSRSIHLGKSWHPGVLSRDDQRSARRRGRDSQHSDTSRPRAQLPRREAAAEPADTLDFHDGMSAFASWVTILPQQWLSGWSRDAVAGFDLPRARRMRHQFRWTLDERCAARGRHREGYVARQRQRTLVVNDPAKVTRGDCLRALGRERGLPRAQYRPEEGGGLIPRPWRRYAPPRRSYNQSNGPRRANAPEYQHHAHSAPRFA